MVAWTYDKHLDGCLGFAVIQIDGEGKERTLPAIVRFKGQDKDRPRLWFDPNTAPRYTSTIEIDLASVEPSLAGPTRTQDRLPVSGTKAAIASMKKNAISIPDQPNDGAVAIAAITSCANTSDPRLVIAAGLLARKARAYGLHPPHWVKSSLAPGSPTAERYLRRVGLLRIWKPSVLASSATAARPASEIPAR